MSEMLSSKDAVPLSETRLSFRRPLARWLVVGACAICVVGACSSRERQLQRDLNSPDPDKRASAATRLAKRDPKGAVSTLIRMLDDRAARVRVAAANALGKLKAVGAAKALGALLRDQDPRVRLAAVRALAKLGRETAADFLLGAVEDPYRQVRRLARFALQDLGMARPEQQRLVAARLLYRYRRQLISRIPARRTEAVQALGRSGRPSIVSDLEKLVGDPYVDVAEQAAASLGLVGGDRSVSFLERLGEQGDHGKQLARRGFLALLEGRQVAAGGLAHRLLTSSDVPLRMAALKYLLAPPEGVTRPEPGLLCRVLAHPDDNLVTRMAELLMMAKIVCPRRDLREPRVAMGGALTRSGPLTPAEASWVRQTLSQGRQGDSAYKTPSARLLAMAVAARRGGPALRRLILGQVQRAYRALLEASERWLDERSWKRLEQWADAGQRPPLSREPRRASPARTTPAARQEAKLRRLLARFPNRADGQSQELMPPLRGPSALTRQLATLAAVQEAWPWLARLARAAPFPVRKAALQALGRSRCESKECLQALGRGSTDPDPALRRIALGAMGQRASHFVTELVGRLRDADPQARAAASAALARSQSAKAFVALRAAFRRSREAHLIDAFGRLGDPRAERLLLSVLRERHSPLQSGERLALVEALERVGTRAAVERLLPELEHPEPAIRRGAAQTLGRIGDRQALAALAVCGEDFYRAVRVACEAAAARIRAREKATQGKAPGDRAGAEPAGPRSLGMEPTGPRKTGRPPPAAGTMGARPPGTQSGGARSTSPVTAPRPPTRR